MKRLFGRDKPKIVKAPSGTSDLGPEDAPYSNDHQHGPQTYDRMHSQDRVHALAHSSSDEHWDLVNSHDGHSPIPSSYVPRAASPFSGTVSVGSNKSNGDRDSTTIRKKPPNAPSPAAAVGILRALDPHHSQVLTTPPPTREHDRESMLEESLQHRPSEKKERKGFWERAKDRDKDKDKVREEERKERQGHAHGLRSRDKDKERKEEEAQAELTRMIGYLTATASEDWSLVLEVCERASANEPSARETVKALRREFKYAEPTAQLAAARLWAVLLQNSSNVFMVQSTSRKFIETLEEVIQNPRTSPVVKERLLQVLAAAAHASSARHNRPEKDPFRLLWRKLRAPNQPDEGIPLDPEDAMLNPPAAVPPVASDTPRTPSGRPPNKHKTSPKIIPPEEDIRRLFEECKYANGNAALLSDALLHAKPEDLQGKAIIKEFYARCRASQELVYAQIPWASVTAEKSRQAAIVAATNAPHRHRKTSPPDSPQVGMNETIEEQLLGALLSANEQLAESLKMYEDMERIRVEKDVEERSRRDTRMSHKHQPQRHNSSDSSIPHTGAHARVTPVPPVSPSPSPSPSPPLSVTVTPYTPNYTHPLPPIPPHSAQHGKINAQQQLAALALQQHQPPQSLANLAPPPPAPHGPRRPVPSYQSGGSRSPSPTDRSFIASTGPPSVRMKADDWDRHGELRQSVHTPRGKAYSNILEMEDDDEVEVVEAIGEERDSYDRPRGPSAKALGKRRIVEPEETDSQFDPDDIFYEHNNDSRQSTSINDDNDSDAEGGAASRRRRAINYVYDAAAEKTRERIREGRLHLAASNGATLVGGVH